MTNYIISTGMHGYLPEGDPEPFEASPVEAIDALLAEAEFQLDGMIDAEDVDAEADEVLVSDVAFVQSLKGAEGRGDLLSILTRTGSVAICIDSYANGFGGMVSLAEAPYWQE